MALALLFYLFLFMPNLFSQDIPAPVLAAVQTNLDAIKAALAPYLLSLTPEQR